MLATHRLSMAPISDLADTLSFGLVGKIRRKAHPIENHLETVDESWDRSRHSSSWENLKKLSSSYNASMHNSAENLKRQNTITVAYSFNPYAEEGEFALTSLNRSVSGNTHHSNPKGTKTHTASYLVKNPSGSSLSCFSKLDRTCKSGGDTTGDRYSRHGGVISDGRKSLPGAVTQEQTKWTMGTSSTNGSTKTTLLEPGPEVDVVKSDVSNKRRVDSYFDYDKNLDDDSPSICSSGSEQQYKLVLDDHIIP